MPGLPVPMFVAVVFGYLALRILLVKDRPAALAVLLGALALQGVILSYKVFLPVQPVTAAAIPPLAWVVFQVSAVRPFDVGRDLWHLAVPAFVLFAVLASPWSLDFLIPAIFIVYAVALLIRLRRGPDSLPRLSLASGERPGLIWSLIAGALLVSAFGDIAIAAVMWAGQDWARPWIVVVLTVGNLAGIGLLSLSSALATPTAAVAEDPEEGTPIAPTEDAAPTPADLALMDRLDSLMTKDGVYLDPDLSLARIARRLVVPAKHVSAAVNRVTGENVSRLINGYRIRHACARLAAGDSVTSAMLASGFNTKSNFNREFLRVTGLSPSQWLGLRENASPASSVHADPGKAVPSKGATPTGQLFLQ